MMVGMMVPSVAPTVLAFAAINRKRAERGGPYVPRVRREGRALGAKDLADRGGGVRRRGGRADGECGLGAVTVTVSQPARPLKLRCCKRCLFGTCPPGSTVRN